MNTAVFRNPEFLYWFILIPLYCAAMVMLSLWRRRFAASAFGFATSAVSLRHVKTILTVAGLCLAIIALARPAWNPRPVQKQVEGHDIVFVLDVSKSMLAEDLAPNRLERAKRIINDIVARDASNRVALVVFAGNAVLKCPLTHDYAFFISAVDSISTQSVSTGGTRIADALRGVLDMITAENSGVSTDVILLTDGEDHHGDPVKAAEKAGEKGVRLVTIGLGDEDIGKRVPVTDKDGNKTFLTYRGKEVWSRLDALTLKKMAESTRGGSYINVATKTLNIAAVRNIIQSASREGVYSVEESVSYEDKFHLFLTIAVLLLLTELFLPERIRT